MSGCPVCDDDGFYEVWDDIAGDIVANRECPYLGNRDHAPFNSRGILPETWTLDDVLGSAP